MGKNHPEKTAICMNDFLLNNKTLYIHIGGQKTGSTAIQSYLSSNTSLNSRICVVTAPDFDSLFQCKDLEDFSRKLSQKIYDSEQTTFVLSSELLCHLEFEQLSSLTRKLKNLNIVWIFVHRQPSQVLLSHWADRTTLFGDTLDFEDYVPMRIKSPFIQGRSYLFEKVQSGDLEFHKLLAKFERVPGAKKLLVYSPNVLADLLGHLVPSAQNEIDQSLNHRVHTSPGIATTYLCMENLQAAVKTLGAPIPWRAMTETSRLIRGLYSTIDFSPRTSQIEITESLYRDFSFLRPDISRFVKESAWEIIGNRHAHYDELQNEEVDWRQLRNYFLKEIEEVRKGIDGQLVIRLAMDLLKSYVIKKSY